MTLIFRNYCPSQFPRALSDPVGSPIFLAETIVARLGPDGPGRDFTSIVHVFLMNICISYEYVSYGSYVSLTMISVFPGTKDYGYPSYGYIQSRRSAR